ncbi:hypothetical protein V8C35DRAFT_326930 [Trichoderma chlorosporum]
MNARDPSDEDIEMLQTEARRLDIYESDEWVQEWVEVMRAITSDGDQRLLKLMLARLPNAEYVSIEAPFFDEIPSFEDSHNNRIVMKSVRRLSICPGDSFDLALTGNLLSIMPRVEQLTVYDCGRIRQRLPLAGLRTLILSRSLIDETSLKNIIDSCPELEHFEYHIMTAGWSDFIDTMTFTWGEAQRILYSRRTTLKHLNFEFGKEFSAFIEEPLWIIDSLSSLRDFERLETLWVRTTSFGTEDEDEVVPIFPKDVQHLVSMLPQSLRRLGFCGSHSDWNGIETLAEAILEGHFPRLRVVLLEQEKEEFEYSCELLAAVNVRCVALDDSLYGGFRSSSFYDEEISNK